MELVIPPTGATTESSFPIELVGVYSIIELDAAHFQLSSSQFDLILGPFDVKRSIPVYFTRVNGMEWTCVSLFRTILGKDTVVILELDQVYTTLNGSSLLFRVSTPESHK